jgi:hypothetical protein
VIPTQGKHVETKWLNAEVRLPGRKVGRPWVSFFFFFFKLFPWSTYNPSTWEAEAGGL